MDLTTTSTTAMDRMVTLGVCMFAVTVGFVALVVIAGAREHRRPWFALRVLAAAVVVPGMAFLAVQGSRLGLVGPRAEPIAAVLLLGLGVPAMLMFAPAMLYRRPPRREDGGGGGGGRGPEGPSTPQPPHPDGGIPLPDADRSPIRLRDEHSRPERVRRRSDRPGRRPIRSRTAR